MLQLSNVREPYCGSLQTRERRSETLQSVLPCTRAVRMLGRLIRTVELTAMDPFGQLIVESIAIGWPVLWKKMPG
jgi:hypothetical protein